MKQKTGRREERSQESDEGKGGRRGRKEIANRGVKENIRVYGRRAIKVARRAEKRKRRPNDRKSSIYEAKVRICKEERERA